MITITIPERFVTLDPTLRRKALRQSGTLVKRTAQALIRASEGGPGNPPRNQTGELVKSIKVYLKKDKVTIRSNAGYSTALEVGAQGGGGDTYNKSNILPAFELNKDGTVKRSANRMKASAISKVRVLLARPFMNPALEKNEAAIEEILEKATQEGLGLSK